MEQDRQPQDRTRGVCLFFNLSKSYYRINYSFQYVQNYQFMLSFIIIDLS